MDDRLRTANPRISAAGDVCLGHKFTHAADADARIVVRNALFLTGRAGQPPRHAVVHLHRPGGGPRRARRGRGRASAGPVLDAGAPPRDVDRARARRRGGGVVKVHVRAAPTGSWARPSSPAHAGEMIAEVTLAMSPGSGSGGSRSDPPLSHPGRSRSPRCRSVPADAVDAPRARSTGGLAPVDPVSQARYRRLRPARAPRARPARGGRPRVGARALRLGAARAAGPAEADRSRRRGVGTLPLRGRLRGGRAPLRPRAALTSLGGLVSDRSGARSTRGPRPPSPPRWRSSSPGTSRAARSRAGGPETPDRADRRRRRAPRLAHPGGHAPRPPLPVQPPEAVLYGLTRIPFWTYVEPRVGRVHPAGHRIAFTLGGRRALRRRQSGPSVAWTLAAAAALIVLVSLVPRWLTRKSPAAPGTSSPRTADLVGP